MKNLAAAFLAEQVRCLTEIVDEPQFIDAQCSRSNEREERLVSADSRHSRWYELFAGHSWLVRRLERFRD